jgi:hypothetical protein
MAHGAWKSALFVVGTMWVGAARAACPANGEWVRNDTKTALDAYGSGDMMGFQQAVSAVAEDVSCLSEPIGAAQIEAAHLALGLKAIVNDETAVAVAAFQAVYALHPDYQPDDKLAPLDSPARKAMEEAKAKGPGAENKVPPISSGYTWIVDGKESAEPMLPAERATLVLLHSPDGSIVQSKYLPQGGAPAELVGAAQVEIAGLHMTGQTKDSETRSGEKATSRTLIYAAGGCAAVATITLISAAAIKGSYQNAPDSDGLLEGKYTANHVLGYTGYGFAVAAVGLGVTAVVVGRW